MGRLTRKIQRQSATLTIAPRTRGASAKVSPIYHANLVIRFQEPLQASAGLTRQYIKDGKPQFTEGDDPQPVLEGIYGLHDFRHAAASLWIEQRVDPKRVQTWMGHHSISVTFDIYGHLFAALENDAAVMSALEAGLMTDTAVSANLASV